MKNTDALNSGIIVIDKSAGCTSHDVVARARKALGTKKVGHAGTLDPFATGIVILLINEGTKLSNIIMEEEKVYNASILLGEKRDTGDLTGEVIDKSDFIHITEEEVRKTLKNFLGVIKQVPPMYSAIKKNGIPLYKYARKGLEVDRKEREVRIKSISLTDFKLPVIKIEVSCSKGTYIRTLAEDICEKLGTCGHLAELRRTRIGPFSLDKALKMDDMANKDRLKGAIISMSESLPSLSGIVVTEEAVEKISNGRRLMSSWISALKLSNNAEEKKAKLISPDGSLLSIIEVDNGALHSSNPAPDQIPDQVIGRSLRVFNNR